MKFLNQSSWTLIPPSSSRPPVPPCCHVNTGSKKGRGGSGFSDRRREGWVVPVPARQETVQKQQTKLHPNTFSNVPLLKPVMYANLRVCLLWWRFILAILLQLGRHYEIASQILFSEYGNSPLPPPPPQGYALSMWSVRVRGGGGL